MSTEDEYTELFVIEFEGLLNDLKSYLESLDGVEHFSLKRSGFRLHDGSEFENPVTLQADIKYNTHVTDRTRVMLELEELGGVSEAKMG